MKISSCCGIRCTSPVGPCKRESSSSFKIVCYGESEPPRPFASSTGQGLIRVRPSPWAGFLGSRTIGQGESGSRQGRPGRGFAGGRGPTGTAGPGGNGRAGSRAATKARRVGSFVIRGGSSTKSTGRGKPRGSRPRGTNGSARILVGGGRSSTPAVVLPGRSEPRPQVRRAKIRRVVRRRPIGRTMGRRRPGHRRAERWWGRRGAGATPPTAYPNTTPPRWAWGGRGGVAPGLDPPGNLPLLVASPRGELFGRSAGFRLAPLPRTRPTPVGLSVPVKGGGTRALVAYALGEASRPSSEPANLRARGFPSSAPPGPRVSLAATFSSYKPLVFHDRCLGHCYRVVDGGLVPNFFLTRAGDALHPILLSALSRSPARIPQRPTHPSKVPMLTFPTLLTLSRSPAHPRLLLCPSSPSPSRRDETCHRLPQ